MRRIEEGVQPRPRAQRVWHHHRGLRALRRLHVCKHQRQEPPCAPARGRCIPPAPPPSEKHTQVNHKDGNPANNCADNLAWVTPSENNQHSHDTNADRKSNAPKRSKPVLGRRRDGSEEEWVEYESIIAAARELGVAPGNVSACCRGERKRAGEYEFKWAPPAKDQLDRPGEVWREIQIKAKAVENAGVVPAEE